MIQRGADSKSLYLHLVASFCAVQRRIVDTCVILFNIHRGRSVDDGAMIGASDHLDAFIGVHVPNADGSVA